MSFTDPYTIKRISDTNFKYEFYTTNKIINPKEKRIYYWFKGGAIHSAESGIGGQLLTDKYTKMFINNQIAEQGKFKNGLKTGVWKTWYSNGLIQSVQYWQSGQRNGEFLLNNENGVLIEKGSFKKDLKNKKWIDYIKKDTIFYKNGIIFTKKIKISRKQKKKSKISNVKAIDSIYLNSNKKENNKILQQKPNFESSKNLKIDKNIKDNNLENKTEKATFFQKIFGKKKNNSNKNGQSK